MTSDRCPWAYTVLKKGDREIAFFDVLLPFGTARAGVLEFRFGEGA